MPHITRAFDKAPTEQSTPLKTLQPGTVFRFFDGTTYEEALKSEPTAFFMVIPSAVVKADRVSVVALDGKTILERDADRLVIIHPAVFEVGESKEKR